MSPKSQKLVFLLLFIQLCLAPAGLARGRSPSVQAETRFVEAEGVRYAYRSFGKSSRVPLVLMIRYRANMDDWDPAFLDALAKERTVIIVNQSGVSSSSGQVPTTIPGMAADVAKFIRALGFDSVDVLGWSMAGFTAQAITIDHPELVRRVILVGTGPAASDRTPPPGEGVFDVALKDTREDGQTTYSDADRQYLFFADHPRSLQLAEQSFTRIDRARRPDEPVTSPEVREAQTQAIQHWWFDSSNGYFDQLKTIRQPTLILNGDRDVFFTVTASDILYSEISTSQIAIFPMTGHGPQHQYPEEVAKMIDEFLDD